MLMLSTNKYLSFFTKKVETCKFQSFTKKVLTFVNVRFKQDNNNNLQVR